MPALTVTGTWNAQRKCIEVDPIFWDDLKISDKTQVTSVVTTDRNPDQLKAYWAILGDIVESGAWDGDKDTLDDNTRMRVGFGKWRPIASEMNIVEEAFSASWAVWSAMTGLIAKKSQDAFRAAVEAYVKASPPRVVFIPNSIALSKLDGLKFTEFMRSAEKEWAEWLGVDVATLPNRVKLDNDNKRRAA